MVDVGAYEAMSPCTHGPTGPLPQGLQPMHPRGETSQWAHGSMHPNSVTYSEKYEDLGL